MSDFYVHPCRLRGEVDIPPSKSQTLRAVLFASLAQGRSVIRRPLLSPDIQSMLR
ncbi:MAG: 3-phosphoshikimate 1-carboxyvinyltransferase, partial [Chlamydiia bacterium]|nr:3-phosphoshikimate 1-carboxyvinyltransferase [Chlamydiia bacterium]